MSTIAGTDRPAVEAPGAPERRRRRAAIARRLLAGSAQAAAALDWDTLDRAPAWLGWSDDALAIFQCRIGAVLCAPVLRLWIDGARLGAARDALGESFLHALLAQHDGPSLRDAAPRVDAAERVAPALQAAGASVLLATLPESPLRRCAGAALGSATPLAIAPELARELVTRAATLAEQMS
ncbi:MAG TPA: hypothetical protein VF169_21895 [Albitalea sp.]|uniref:hypothetical protein n=1 Tax=Piscinibacter sp. TaxID=1903157 RepID=UPI002ED613CC